MPQHESALERAAPLTGVGFVILAIVGGFLTFGDAEFLGTGEELATHFVENDGAIWTGTSLMLLSVPLLLWFMASLWRRLRTAEGDRSRLSVVAFGGGVTMSAMILMAATAWIAGVARASDQGALGADHAAILYDLAGFLWGGAAPIALATVLLAFAVVTIRTAAFPAWWGWVSGILGIAHLVIPISWIAFFGGAAWILTMGIWLYAEGGRVAGAVAAAGARAA